jgi:hypothetical protein
VRPLKGRTANVAKKKSKQLRDMESTLALLRPDSPAVKEEKSFGNFYVVTCATITKSEYSEPLSLMSTVGYTAKPVSSTFFPRR